MKEALRRVIISGPINIHAIFSSIADKYDRLNTILSFNTDRFWRRKAIKLCQLQPGEAVLDLCCGTGMMIRRIGKKVGPSSVVTGLDFNGEMLRVARKRLGPSGTKYHYSLVEGNALNLPFKDESFDCLTIAFGLRNLPDIPKALAEAQRVLKPGGRFVCLELSNPEMPIFKNIYAVYFNNVLPVLGFLGTGDRQAYRYLKDSVKKFLSKDELLTAFVRAGFQDCCYKSLTGGIAAIHYGASVKIV